MKVLLAIDGSPGSDAAIAEVARRPWPRQGEIRIVTVDPPVDPGLLRGSPSAVFDELVKQQRAESSKLLRDAAANLGQNAFDLQISTSLLEGTPKDAIVAEAERWGADLVVVGSHGYGPVRRFFLGSVSGYVAHHAPCSVEIVRRASHADANPPGQ